MQYVNTSNTQIVGAKHNTHNTRSSTQTETSPPQKKARLLKITPVIRGKMHKRKQTVQITRVLKITPVIRGKMHKRKQTVQITRVLKIAPATRGEIYKLK